MRRLDEAMGEEEADEFPDEDELFFRLPVVVSKSTFIMLLCVSV